MKRCIRALLPVVVFALAVAAAPAADKSAARMRQCQAILNMKGDLRELDISAECDPLFHHIGRMVRDKDERVFHGGVGFFILRPGNQGGAVSFELHLARVQDEPFDGGRFTIAFGDLKTVVVDVPVEDQRLGDYLFDEEAQPAFRLLKGCMQKVVLDVPPLLEGIEIKAQVPQNGAFFLRDIEYSGQARPRPRPRAANPTPVAKQQLAATVTAAASKVQAPPAPPPPPVSAPNDALTEGLKKSLAKFDTALFEIEGHLARAEQKKSGHPAFLDALKIDVKRFQDVKTELQGLLKNPSGYDW